jgi:hypothetical protein
VSTRQAKDIKGGFEAIISQLATFAPNYKIIEEQTQYETLCSDVIFFSVYNGVLNLFDCVLMFLTTIQSNFSNSSLQICSHWLPEQSLPSFETARPSTVGVVAALVGAGGGFGMSILIAKEKI